MHCVFCILSLRFVFYLHVKKNAIKLVQNKKTKSYFVELEGLCNLFELKIQIGFI